MGMGSDTGQYRLIVLDVDGTLVDRERRISTDTLRALAAAQARGIRVTLATGRMYASARPYADRIHADAPLILYNGARIQDPAGGTIRYSVHLPRTQAARGLRLAQQFDVHANLYLGERIYIDRVNEVSRESARKDGVEQVPVGDLVQFLEEQPEDPVKILLIGPGERLEALAAAYRAGAPGGSDLPHLVRSEAAYLEIQPRGVTKGAGLTRLCGLLGIPASAAVAFGDNLNDLEMIQAAGLGVAMGNAHADLKRAARIVAPNYDQDGVAAVLWTHVLSA
jgi:Cof subfamily protein (haloacid dehalogenase superfamily)